MKRKAYCIVFRLMIFFICCSACCLIKKNMCQAEEISGDFGYEILTDGTAKIESCQNKKPNAIPDTIDGYKVTVIGVAAFRRCSFDKLIIPSGVKRIESRAFEDCEEIDEVEFPESLELIQDNAFDDTTIRKLVVKCKNLKFNFDVFSGCELEELHCYYNSTIYKEFGDTPDVFFFDDVFLMKKKKATVGVGAVLYLEAIGNGKLKWNSSNKKVATVNSEGAVLAKKKGKTTITVSNGKKKLKCVVTVKNNEKRFKKYSTNASAYARNQVGMKFSKIERDSKGNYIVTGHIINTYANSTSYIKNLKIKVYDDDFVIAQQTYKTYRIVVNGGSVKEVRIKIDKKNIKYKKTDLRSGDIYVKVAGGKAY